MNQGKAVIRFKIAKNGAVQTIVENNGGKNCLDITSGIEKALGTVDEASREQTAAYSEVDPIMLTNHAE